MAFATYDKYGRNLAYSKGISRDLYRERREREGGRGRERRRVGEGGRERMNSVNEIERIGEATHTNISHEM